MSHRSKKRDRRENRKNRALTTPAAPETHAQQGGAKRRLVAPWLLASAILVSAGILLAVTWGGGRKAESTAAMTNSAPAATPVPADPVQATAAPLAAPAAVVSGPRISFATPVHDFGQIKGGEAVKYSYVFTNIGDRLLELTDVRASCGCTTAGEWSRKVEPGETGSIPIEFASGSFSGQIAKSITVTCNDTNQPTVVLQIKGTIWRAIDVTPQIAALNVSAESPEGSTTVQILNNLEEPLTLSAPEVSNPRFAAELKAIKPGKEFQLIVRTVPPLPVGNLQGQITLKTSSTNLPVINVSTWATVQPVVSVMPPQITLPATPLTNRIPSTVFIRYNGTNSLALSEPAANAQGVDVQLQEIEPGRSFTLTADFPAQFEMAQGESVELQVKSNHPQFPVIHVPVVR